ncbi:helix-turn-helix transcriptional regulator [Knoellia sp. DB2414S]|uniref:Helix-turn-helix transcriptional regulator n=1 Tax=Knoellia koreensis TaxID=2730921 RepID=A0A849H920_9MICO|nr:helix-turn-helix transcriptional regulator [Knoellia sp. DB2414S]NNM46236.1 helix-turn-helix transcriptional regulator [Knoellia sp. DB2414S]
MPRVHPGASPKVPSRVTVVDEREDRNRRLLRARDTIDRCYRDDLDVPGLAAVALMSREHFIREFKKAYGETPYRYLQRRRVERAMQMLRWSERSVTDICMEVGFSSLGTFSRTFTDIVGQTPTEYRASTDRPTGYVPELFTMRWRRPR